MASIAEQPLFLARLEDSQLLRQPPVRRRIRNLHGTHIQPHRQQPQPLGQNNDTTLEPLVIIAPDGSFQSWQNRHEVPSQTHQQSLLHFRNPQHQQHHHHVQQQQQQQQQQQSNYDMSLEQQHQVEQQQDSLQGSAAGNSYQVMRRYVKLLKQHTAKAAHHPPTVRVASTRLADSSSSKPAQAVGNSEQSSQWPILLQHTKMVMPELQHQPQQATAIIYTIAKLRLPAPPRLLLELFQQLQHHQLTQLHTMALTNVLWAAAVLSRATSQAAPAAADTSTITSISTSVDSGDTITPHPANVSNFQLPDGWLFTFYDVTSTGLTAFNQHQLTSLVWSVGQLQQRPPPAWVQGLLASLAPALAALSATQLTNTIWGLARIGYKPNKPWMQLWFQATEQQLPACTPDHLACLAVSLALLRAEAPCSSWMVQFRHRVQQLLVQQKQQQKQLSSQRRQRGRQQQQQQQQDILIRPRQVATILSGLAKQRSRQPPHWVRVLLQTQLAQQQQCQPQELAATVWSLPLLLSPTAAEWSQAPANAALLRDAAAATLPLLPQCGVSELVQLAVGFARLRFSPGARWLKVHEVAMASRHHQLSEDNKARLRQALSKLWLDS